MDYPILYCIDRLHVGDTEINVGHGFKEIVRQPTVASFLFGTQPSELMEKDIYIHGSLRKVCALYKYCSLTIYCYLHGHLLFLLNFAV